MAEPKPQQHRALTAGATCEMALQVISRGCVADLRRHARAAAGGDAEALHRMRIALTRLRTAIRFFAPAVDDPAWEAVRRQISWLSRQSGAARDIDVALARQQRKGAADRTAKQWRKERDRRYDRLRRTLRSMRCRRLIDALSRRSRRAGHGSDPTDHDQPSLGSFSTKRLERWRGRLLREARKLERLGPRRLHRLRLRAKRFRYALEWSLPVLTEGRTVLRKQIRQAKLVQNALGRLNDACAHRAQAEALGIDPLPSMLRLGRQKSQQRLMKSASRAFEELGRSNNASNV